MSSNNCDIGAFVMPVFLDKGKQSVKWLNEAIDSILAQTSSDWRLVIVDDASPLSSIESVLKDVASRDGRIHIIRSKTNQGPGAARNIGISWAYENNFPIVLFLDYDDIAHPDRLRVVREAMAKDPTIGVVYSTFQVIDENSRELPWDELSASIQEILECNRNNPPQGETAWIDIGTVTGYANLTSSTAVRTEIARKHPFFACGVSEDAHAWLRYAAEGKKFVYEGSIPTLYRIPQYASGSSSRDRVGGTDIFYAKKCDIDEDGFAQAMSIALKKGKIKAAEINKLLVGFYVRLAETMRRTNQDNLADKVIKRAKTISPILTQKWIDLHGYDWK